MVTSLKQREIKFTLNQEYIRTTTSSSSVKTANQVPLYTPDLSLKKKNELRG